MSGGTSSIQYNKRKYNLALLNKAWPMTLSYLLVWENEWVLRELGIDNVSLTIWAIIERGEGLVERAL